MSQNEYYWKNPRLLDIEPPISPTTPTTTSTTPPPDTITLGLIAGIVFASVVIVVGGYLVVMKT